MKINIKGPLLKVFPVVQVSEKFAKQEFVVETGFGKYSSPIKCEAHKEAIDMLAKIKPGEKVIVNAHLRGSKWVNPEGKEMYFTTVAVFEVVPYSPRQGAETAPEQDDVGDAYENPAF